MFRGGRSDNDERDSPEVQTQIEERHIEGMEKLERHSDERGNTQRADAGNQGGRERRGAPEHRHQTCRDWNADTDDEEESHD